MTENLPDTNVGNIEYISKADAVDALKAQADTMRKWASRYDEQRRGVLTAVNIVEDIKPADVVQVVHGRWLPIVSYNNTYKCSECGRLLVDITDGLKMVAKHYPYCHCGAKMDGGDEHG